MITTQSSISLTRQAVPPIIQAVQGDSGRNILFNLRDETIPEGATAAFYIAKPSGEFVYNVATVQDAHTVLVPLDAQCIIEPGENRGQVRISANDEVVTSFDFILDVQKFYGMDAAQSGSESSLFEQIVEQYEASAKEYAETSEAYAVGKRNGTDVGSSDPAYHNNAKYYADDASDSATSAAASAEAAAQSAALVDLASIAPKFSSSTAYTAGDYVYYNDTLYRFTADHTAGAWTGTDAETVTVGGDLNDLKGAICLQEENIPGTTQTITFDSSGNVSQIKHYTTGTTTAVRTDVFTFAANSITEVRTLATGESLTIVTNTTTLETTVTYAVA